ncbi:tetratricopeptide repeat protein [Novosphingobium sp. FKTRR1]|uniref:tetratricopeptide repeat protein n=1 Tax=unclassified Novosphingobium TaxID=2644732 RepID=UPI001CF028EC|nr:tetratricopeptide repeat protein [Novosphingobium sp. FKTRR1]
MALLPTNPKSLAERQAERKIAQDNVFLREVDDALREDDAARLLRRYGRPVGVAVVAGLVSLAGWLWYDNHRASVAGEHGEQFVVALDQLEGGRGDLADKSFAKLATDGGPGYGAAARLMQAGLALQAGKRDDAVKLYAAVATDSAAPKAYRDLAVIREVTAQFDNMPPQQVIDRLKPFAVPGNPWFGSAGELVAIAYLKQGKGDLAGPLFAAIAKDKDVPDTLRRRSRQLAAQQGIDAIEDPTAAVQLSAQ